MEMQWINLIGLIIKCFTFLISVLAVIVGVYQFYRQHKLSFFEKYTSRYQHIMEIMPGSVLDGKPLSKKDNEKAICAIRLYIDLCSEEFYLHEHRYIEEKVWNEWKEGMKIMFSHPAVIDVFEKKYQKSYKKFANFITQELNNGECR